MSKKRVTTLKVAATYIGMIVGSGLATVQETIKFSGGKILGTIKDLIITISLFGSFTAMIFEAIIILCQT